MSTTSKPMPPALTLWLTGLSAAGKTTLAEAVALQLQQQGQSCVLLDGDVIRREFSRDLGFSKADRRENLRRVASRCQQLNASGSLVLVSLISPYQADRAMARDIIGAERFVEIYLSTPLQVCEQRDPKGLYRKARAGELQQFTGVDDPYEAPQQPDLALDTASLSLEHCVTAVLDRLYRSAGRA